MKTEKQSETTKSPSKSVLPLWFEFNIEQKRPSVTIGRTNDYEATYFYVDELDKLLEIIFEFKRKCI